jgi:hypothetical protein
MIKTAQDAYLAGRQAALTKLASLGTDYADAMANREREGYLKNIGLGGLKGGGVGAGLGALAGGALSLYSKDPTALKMLSLAGLKGGALGGAINGALNTYATNRNIDRAAAGGNDRKLLEALVDDAPSSFEDGIRKSIEIARQKQRAV